MILQVLGSSAYLAMSAELLFNKFIAQFPGQLLSILKKAESGLMSG